MSGRPKAVTNSSRQQPGTLEKELAGQGQAAGIVPGPALAQLLQPRHHQQPPLLAALTLLMSHLRDLLGEGDLWTVLLCSRQQQQRSKLITSSFCLSVQAGRHESERARRLAVPSLKVVGA